MKKKFLSLMMAAAVVATTSVSAFADEREGATYPDSANVKTQDNQDGNADITITGNVTDNKGNMPTASFKVTVPTAASFTVNKEGGFIGANLEVKNEGAQEIEVYAQSFTRIDGGTGTINTVTAQQIKDDESTSRLTRAHVALKLEGPSNEKAYLKASSSGTGVYANEGLEESAGDNGVKLLSLGAGNTDPQTAKIKLNGSAGKGEVENAITDKFQLTLKIKKVKK